MFGSCCSGRPVQMAEQVDANKYAINITNGTKISHVAIFLLPNVELDPTFTALIYFQLPNQDFRLFGSVSSAKPSAIFKLNNAQQTQSQIMDDMDMETDGETTDPMNNITVGISIEPTADAEVLLDNMRASQVTQPKQIAATAHSAAISPSNPNTTAQLAGKIVKHAYNYLTSFVEPDGKVNIKYFDTWWDKFRTRLNNDPKFLDSSEE